MKLFKQIIIGLIAALITAGGVTIYAQSGDQPQAACDNMNKSFADVLKEDGGKDTDDAKDDENLKNTFAAMGYLCVKSLYHEEMNDFFNGKLEVLLNLLKETDFEKYPAFQVPGDVDVNNYKDLCKTDNVSTYCVSMQALDIYVGYTKVLDRVGGYLPFELPGGDNGIISKVFKESGKRSAAIAAEVENARKVMEATIGAYNEFRLAYPMHKKYEQIIKDLVKYKLKLKRIRSEVIEFPIKFVDATSTACK
jgi:hypothetical protein